jgi:hypothetical protein
MEEIEGDGFEEIEGDGFAMPHLRPMFDGAKRFGLTDDEIWQTVDDCLLQVGGEATVSEYLGELSGALARHILAKQRRTVSGERCVRSEELFQ